MPTHIWPMTMTKSGLSPGARLARACPHMSSMNYSAANRSSVCMWHVSPMCRSSTAKLSKSQMRRPQVAPTMHIMGVTITRGLSSRASSHWSTKGVNVAAGPPATSTTTPPPSRMSQIRVPSSAPFLARLQNSGRQGGQQCARKNASHTAASGLAPAQT